jgi:hypothetical protein
MLKISLDSTPPVLVVRSRCDLCSPDLQFCTTVPTLVPAWPKTEAVGLYMLEAKSRDSQQSVSVLVDILQLHGEFLSSLQ